MRNSANAALKEELRDNGVLYEDLAKQTCYSLSSIKKFMAKPMSMNTERFIRSAMDKILESRSSKG